ncbi:hypothetical protein DWB77_00929 [Streptomyces hundungensis]|uniref:DUF998 domain-containing protein n=1 Tax=Streptomyces hundungensis TaxID=1077946 RepID=A0A387HCW8_9ACTN|nr:DUF6629 family protein [Streptomyces hundungensis]AYG78820.1 hypothetical protein DWB77_00929 [Streptomyces hundungensis]
MCWSATADLIAGGAITAVGMASVASAARRPLDLPLAALPLLLGGHQIVEVVVWHNGGGTGPATVIWAVIALPLVALWVPAAVLCAAPPGARRRLLILLVAGVATCAALAHALASRPVTAEIRGHTVGYSLGLPWAGLIVLGYLFATIGSLLLSGDRGLVLFGVLVAVGAAVSFGLWRQEYISTWCAFAALCSVVLWFWVGRRRPRTPVPSAEPAP